MYVLFFFFLKLLSPGRLGKEASSGSLGTKGPLSIFRIFPVKLRKRYQSHFEALGLHLFVRDAQHRSDDSANSSNPTYSKGVHTKQTDAHIHTHRICCLPQPLCFQASSESERWMSEALIEEAAAATLCLFFFSLSHLFLQLVWWSRASLL